jgi:hypothetical protein
MCYLFDFQLQYESIAVLKGRFFFNMNQTIGPYGPLLFWSAFLNIIYNRKKWKQ